MWRGIERQGWSVVEDLQGPSDPRPGSEEITQSMLRILRPMVDSTYVCETDIYGSISLSLVCTTSPLSLAIVRYPHLAKCSCSPGKCQRHAHEALWVTIALGLLPGSERGLVCSPLSTLVPTHGRSFCLPLIVSSTAALPSGPIVVDPLCFSSRAHPGSTPFTGRQT